MTFSSRSPFLRKIDYLQVPVPDLDAGLAFYQGQLSHKLIWRTPTQAGLRLPETDAELVLQTEWPSVEVNLLVESVVEAAARIVHARG